MYEILKENYGKFRRKKKNLICYCFKIKVLLKFFNCMVFEINIMYNVLYFVLVILFEFGVNLVLIMKKYKYFFVLILK